MSAAEKRPMLGQLAEPPRSEYACGLCKRRKIKCDRSLPICSICQKTRQKCEYPLEAAKPGPKIGTTRRKRAKSRSSDRQTGRNTAPGGRDVANRRASTDLDVDVNMDVADGDTATNSTGIVAPQNLPLTPVSPTLDVRTLAYIVHPSHDVAAIPTPDDGLFEDVDLTEEAGTSFGIRNPIAHACSVLGISTEELQKWINLYFDHMTAFSLFHRPSFQTKLQNITTTTQLVAFLASMFSFSARFRSGLVRDSSDPDQDHFDDDFREGLSHSPQHFENLSQQYVDEALRECSDKSPPLCLLQALILLTFQQLIKGVCGSAWRRLGVCIRAAYELDLHHVDRDNVPQQQDSIIWSETEERRRAWWAIWEMDVFSSTIKRCPCGIDWTDNDTRLPVSDEHWFQREFRPSCFLEIKPMDRVKALQQCGTQSTKAWLIVLTSLMRDGHVISKFRSSRPGSGRHGLSRLSTQDVTHDTAENVAILANALHCFNMALPASLRYRDEYLSFSSRDPDLATATRQLHSAKYTIYVNTQLARIMIHHHDAYLGAQQDLRLTGAINLDQQHHSGVHDSDSLSLHLGPQRKGLQQYIEAADELLHIVSRSSKEHVRYVNPFLASTIWYGAAVHLSWKVLAPPRTNHDFIASKFEVMRMSFDESTAFWNLPKALQENLRSMEEKLRIFTAPKKYQGAGDRRGGGRGGGGGGGGLNQGGSMVKRTTNLQSGLWGTGPAGTTSSAPEILAANTMRTSTDGKVVRGTTIQHPSFPDNSRSESDLNSGVSDNPGRFVFDGSWPACESLGGQGEERSQQEGQLASREVWDDLGLDLDFATNPDVLFQGLMTYQ